MKQITIFSLFCALFSFLLPIGEFLSAGEVGSAENDGNFFQSTAPLETLEDSKDLMPGARKGLFQRLGLEIAWIPSGGSDGMGMTRLNTNISFALPAPRIGHAVKSFFLMTPSFGYTNIDWKRGTEFPDSLYTAGLSITWIQIFNERWSMMLSATPGWSSDGKESEDSVRCPVMLGWTWTPNKRWKIVFGAAYLDRSDVNFLPYGGLVWTPNDDIKLELTAPQARLAWRSYSNGLFSGLDNDLERWNYVGFGFGGGSWAIESVGGQADFAMYQEYSLLLGTERIRKGGCTCNVEIAYLFGRRMEFDRNTQSTYKPDDALHLRLKFAY